MANISFTTDNKIIRDLYDTAEAAQQASKALGCDGGYRTYLINNETKYVKLNRKMETDSLYYELSCGRQDGTGINKIFVLKETLENRVRLVNAIGDIIRMI